MNQLDLIENYIIYISPIQSKELKQQIQSNFIPYVRNLSELQYDKTQNLYLRPLIVTQNTYIDNKFVYPVILIQESILQSIIDKEIDKNTFKQIYPEQLFDSYERQIKLIKLRIAQQFWVQQDKSISEYQRINQELNSQLKIVKAQQFAFQADVAQITYQTRGFKQKQLDTIQSGQTITFGNYLASISQAQDISDKQFYEPVSSGGVGALQQHIYHLNCLLTTQILLNSTKNPMLMMQCNPQSNSCILQYQNLNEAMNAIQSEDYQLEANILKAVHSLAQLIHIGYKQAQRAKEEIEKEIQVLEKEDSIPTNDRRYQQNKFGINMSKSDQLKIKQQKRIAQQFMDNDELQELVSYSVQKPGQLYAYQPDNYKDVINIQNQQHNLWIYEAKRNFSIYETVKLIAEFLRLQTIADSQQAQKASQMGLIKMDLVMNAKLLTDVFIPKYIIEFNQQIIQSLAQVNLNQFKKNNSVPYQVEQYHNFIAAEKKKQHLNQILPQQKQIQEDEQPGDCLLCGFKFDNYKTHIQTGDHIRNLDKEFENKDQIREQAIKLQRLQILKQELEEIRDDGILYQAQRQLCDSLDNQQTIAQLSEKATFEIQQLLDQWQIPIKLEQNVEVLQDQYSMKYREDQMVKRQLQMETMLTGVGSRKSGYKRIKQVSELFCQYCADIIGEDNTEYQVVKLQPQDKIIRKQQCNWKYGYNNDPEYDQFQATVYAILLNYDPMKANKQQQKEAQVTNQLKLDEFYDWQKITQRELDIKFSNFGYNWSDKLDKLEYQRRNEKNQGNKEQSGLFKNNDEINEEKLKDELNQVEICVIPQVGEIVKLYCQWKNINDDIYQLINFAKQQLAGEKFQKYVYFDGKKAKLIKQNQKMQIPYTFENYRYVKKHIEHKVDKQIQDSQIDKVVKQLNSINKNTIHQLMKHQLHASNQEEQPKIDKVISPIIHNNVYWQSDKWATSESNDNTMDDLHVNSAFAALTTMSGGPLFYQEISNLIWGASADVLVSASQCINVKQNDIQHNETFDIATLMLCALKSRLYKNKNLINNKKKDHNPTDLEIASLDSITTSLYQNNAGE